MFQSLREQAMSEEKSDHNPIVTCARNTTLTEYTTKRPMRPPTRRPRENVRRIEEFLIYCSVGTGNARAERSLNGVTFTEGRRDGGRGEGEGGG